MPIHRYSTNEHNTHTHSFLSYSFFFALLALESFSPRRHPACNVRDAASFFSAPFPEVSLNRRPRYLTDERILVSEALIITTLFYSPDNRLWYRSGDNEEMLTKEKTKPGPVSSPTINAPLLRFVFHQTTDRSHLGFLLGSFLARETVLGSILYINIYVYGSSSLERDQLRHWWSTGGSRKQEETKK